MMFLLRRDIYKEKQCRRWPSEKENVRMTATELRLEQQRAPECNLQLWCAVWHFPSPCDFWPTGSCSHPSWSCWKQWESSLLRSTTSWSGRKSRQSRAAQSHSSSLRDHIRGAIYKMVSRAWMSAMVFFSICFFFFLPSCKLHFLKAIWSLAWRYVHSVSTARSTVNDEFCTWLFLSSTHCESLKASRICLSRWLLLKIRSGFLWAGTAERGGVGGLWLYCRTPSSRGSSTRFNSLFRVCSLHTSLTTGETGGGGIIVDYPTLGLTVCIFLKLQFTMTSV